MDTMSFRELLLKVSGGPLDPQIETALQHYFWSSFGGTIDEVGAAAGVNFYASELTTNVVILPGGNSCVAEKFVEKLNSPGSGAMLRPKSLVFDVSADEQGVNISYLDSEGKVKCVRSRVAIMSCPKFVASKLINEIEPARVEDIKKLKYRSYFVANLLLKGNNVEPFYDLYLLKNAAGNIKDIIKETEEQGVTDVILGNFATSASRDTVLTLYRAFPYDGARPLIFSNDSYERYRKTFEDQISSQILPMLGLQQKDVVDLRIARWGHPLPLAEKGLIASGTLENIQMPFRKRVFFAEQDNWALPAFETAILEAIYWQKKAREMI